MSMISGHIFRSGINEPMGPLITFTSQPYQLSCSTSDPLVPDLGITSHDSLTSCKVETGRERYLIVLSCVMDIHSLAKSIPLIDVGKYVSTGGDVLASKEVAHSLENYGAVIIRDPRVTEADSENFVNMMERYFAQSREMKMQDVRPEFFYQVGCTPDYKERPRDNSEFSDGLTTENKPVSDPKARLKDPKWRFFWRMGERPAVTEYPQLNAAPVIPINFKHEWAHTMDSWGSKLLQSVYTVAELLALGLGLPRKAVTEKMRYGAHLLAPTGSDMSKYGGEVGTVIAGYHYDISSLTIHGRARFPGLYIWRKDGVRVPVVVPEGALLVQSGAQLEYLTAGRVEKGMHEVVVSKETAEAAKKARESGKPAWRVSSTLFAHVGSDESLKPLLANGGRENNYPNIKAGEQVANELRDIELAEF